MSKSNSHLLCSCGSPFESDDFDYYCQRCADVRFPRHVSNGNGETDLIEILNLVSKDKINVVDQNVDEQGSRVHYSALTYTFVRKGQDWALTNMKETRRVWEDKDPQTVSDAIQLLLREGDIDFSFSKE